MTVKRLELRIAALAAVVVVAACGGGVTTTAPTQAAPTELPPPSIDRETFDLGSLGIPSLAIPSFAGDEELEAMLPDTIGGLTVAKTSVSGAATLNLPAGSALESQLGAMGATVDDLSGAIGNVGDAVVVFAYKVDGVSADRIFEGLEDALQAGGGGTVTETAVAGRKVTVVEAGAETTYIYLASGVVFIIGGTLTPELLRDAVSQLPAP